MAGRGQRLGSGSAGQRVGQAAARPVWAPRRRWRRVAERLARRARQRAGRGSERHPGACALEWGRGQRRGLAAARSSRRSERATAVQQHERVLSSTQRARRQRRERKGERERE